MRFALVSLMIDDTQCYGESTLDINLEENVFKSFSSFGICFMVMKLRVSIEWMLTSKTLRRLKNIIINMTY